MRGKRGSGLVWTLAIALAAIGLGTVFARDDLQRLASRLISLLPERDAASHTPVAARPTPFTATRTAKEGGRVVVVLTPEERARIGLETARRLPESHIVEIQAYGSVLDLARVTELANSYATATAQLQTAQARVDVSRAAFQRAKSLGPYATQVQIETTEGTFQTDRAALTAAQSQVRTLSATAQQEWGPVIGRGIVERSDLVTRLIERADFLVQVTLPPGESLRGPPGAAFAEVPPQSERVPLRFVSAATRTDQRIQGLSSFYTVSGESGLLPGMSTLAFIASPRAAAGVLVPEEAVVHWQGGAWFYRAVGETGFARHALGADPALSGDGFVVADLTGETEIVLRGAQALLSEEMKAQAQASGGADDD